MVSPLTRAGLMPHDRVAAAQVYAPNALPTEIRDLAYARALAEASRRMLEQPDRACLWPLIAVEAATLIPADRVGIVCYSGGRWRLIAAHHNWRANGDGDFEVAINAADRHSWIREPCYIDDLRSAAGWSKVDVPDACASWRSLLVVSVRGVARTDLTRLVWCTNQPGSLGAFVDVAQLVGSHASAAVRSVRMRESLNEAVAARHRIGLAQGILMARHGLTAEEAFQALKRHSQDTNAKLRSIADKIISGRSTSIR